MNEKSVIKIQENVAPSGHLREPGVPGEEVDPAGDPVEVGILDDVDEHVDGPLGVQVLDVGFVLPDKLVCTHRTRYLSFMIIINICFSLIYLINLIKFSLFLYQMVLRLASKYF